MKDLTIEQYIKIQLAYKAFANNETKLVTEIVKILFGSLDVKKSEADIAIDQLAKLFEKEHELINRFEFMGKEWGLIPNFEEMTVGEWIDLDNYLKDADLNLHKITAILYRPITKKLGSLYQIEKYESSSKYADTLSKASYMIPLGALVFFCELRKILNLDSLISTELTK